MKKFLFLTLALSLLLFSLNLKAQIFISFDQIPGESQAVNHKAKMETELLSVSLGNTSPVTLGGASTGLGAGKVKFEDISFTKRRGISSALLQTRLFTNKTIPKVVLTFYRTGEIDPYITITMTNVFITALSVAASGLDAPTESVSFAYSTIKWDEVYKDAGNMPIKTTTQWNVVTNTSVI